MEMESILLIKFRMRGTDNNVSHMNHIKNCPRKTEIVFSRKLATTEGSRTGRKGKQVAIEEGSGHFGGRICF